MKILFLGSSRFSKIVLEKLINSKHEIIAVVTQPDRPSGRGCKLIAPEIKNYAQSKGFRVLQFEKVNHNIDEIFSLEFDLFVTASFGQILSREFLSKKMGLNVHPSKLPKYRGPTPLQTALLNGDTKTSVTIQKMEYEVDSGDILLCEDVEINDDDDFLTLEEKTANLGGSLLVKALDLIEKKEEVFKKQNSLYATYTKMIRKEDGFLDFNNSADNIVNKIRAISENPGCYFFIKDDRIKVKKARICREIKCESNQIEIRNKRFFIGSKDYAVEILKCQAPNGKVLDTKDFLNGYKFLSNKVN